MRRLRRTAAMQPSAVLARGMLLTLYVMGYVMGFTTSGCVLPTKLEERPPTLDRPTVFSANPPFGVLAPGDATIQLMVSAQDSSPLVSTLYTRMFLSISTAGTLDYLFYGTIPLKARDAKDQTVFTGEVLPSTGVPLCAIPRSGDLFVVVGNAPFCDPPFTTACPSYDAVQPGGLTDQNHWDLQCQ